MKKEFEIYQDNEGNVYIITTELEELLLNDLVELHSIIKEVREYIENNLWSDYGDKCDVSKKEIFQILDKENK